LQAIHPLRLPCKPLTQQQKTRQQKAVVMYFCGCFSFFSHRYGAKIIMSARMVYDPADMIIFFAPALKAQAYQAAAGCVYAPRRNSFSPLRPPWGNDPSNIMVKKNQPNKQ